MLTIKHIVGGRVEDAAPRDIDRLLEAGTGVLWIDLAAPTPDEETVLDDPALALHPLVLEDMREDSHLPKLDVLADHLLLTVHVVEIEASTIELETSELDIALGERFLVTYHQRPVAPTEHVAGELDRLAPVIDRPVLLLHRLLDVMDDVFVPFLDLIGHRLDMVEEDVIASPTARTRDEIFALRRDLITLRRISVPQAEVIRRLGREDIAFVADTDRALFRDIHDHLYRMAEVSEVYRQLVESAYDMYRSVRDDETTRRLTVLTMVSTILLPIGVVAGIYGMNFQHMPELDEPMAYPIVWAIFAVIVIAGISIFRSWGWLGRREHPTEAARRSVIERLEIPALGRALRVPEYGARFVTAPRNALRRYRRRRVRP